ncbi:MAG: DNA repair protein RecN, partial [Alphaproteobacteria bacterium]|nr:DNA repair protein RecN [Alphaproteobacteria bacterium]
EELRNLDPRAGEESELANARAIMMASEKIAADLSEAVDALGLATGGRAERGFIRGGAGQASVTAVFDPPAAHPARAALSGNGLESAGALIFRRAISPDGRSRAFINDQPVSIGLMREAGAMLLEIHGQHDDRGLLDAVGHRNLLDAFGRLNDEVADVESAWRALAAAEEAVRAEAESQSRAAQDFEYLNHVAEELRNLDPRAGEESELANARAIMMASEKIAADLSEAVDALTGRGGIEARLNLALRRLSRAQSSAQGRLDAAVAALDRAVIEATEARRAVDIASKGLAFDPGTLEKAETRLFALRAAARKYGSNCDGLAAKRADTEARLAAMSSARSRAVELERVRAAARKAYDAAAQALTAARTKAAAALDARVAKELAPLKLGNALFRTQIDRLANDAPGPVGQDRVEFMVATNPGAPFGALTRIASGGELARFILALKVALADEGSASTLIFDEVDRGVGGAVADAVGERLARLAQGEQVLVVTHSPQVAARGTHHLRVAKAMAAGAMTTRVELLDAAAKREEIARMLAGAKVTDEARAAADQLIGAPVATLPKRRRAT